MSRKIPAELLYYASEQIASGRYLKDVAREIGYDKSVVSRKVRELTGVIPINRSRPSMFLDVPSNEIISLYEAGKSESAIAKQFGCSRQVVRRRLVDAGVHIRSCQEANSLWIGKTTKEFRQAITEAAHAAVRGKKYTVEDKIHRAISREKSGYQSHFGPGETELCSRLDKEGISYIRQKAVNIYNIDICIGTIAVELTIGTCKYQGAFVFERKRIKKILDCGYSVILIGADTLDAMLYFLDDIIAHIKRISRQPSSGRKNWVIRCRKSNCSVIRNQSGQFAAIPTPENFIYSARTINFS